MALQEVTNTVSRFSSSDDSSSSLNTAPSTESCSSSASTSSATSTSRTTTKHPWAEGKKVLKPVEEGEKMRSLRLRKKSGMDNLTKAAMELGVEEGGQEAPLSPRQAYLCTADLIEANDRLREELIKVYASRDEQMALLDGLRESHAVVCSQLEATRNELGSQEDELFVLREMHEEHAREIGELRKAKEFAEVERSLAVKAKEEAEDNHKKEVEERVSEVASLKKRLKVTEEELAEAKHTQAAQQEACMELLEEQKKLEEAYDEAVAQLDLWKHHQGMEEEGSEGIASPSQRTTLLPFVPDQDPLADVSQDWEKVEVGDATATPPRKGKPASRKAPSRFLSKRRRTPSQPLLFNAPVSGQSDVQLVKNDVEQLKQTIALLVRERGASFDGQRTSLDGGQ